MKHAIALLLLVCGVAHAQGFNDQPLCYGWNGGSKSSGSFSKCGTGIPADPVKVAAAPQPAVVPAPIMQTPVCQPAPKKTQPVIKKRPAPQKC